MSFHRCTACDADLFDDPHFDDDTQEPLCDGCCPCMFSAVLLDSDAGTGEQGNGSHDTVPATSAGGLGPAPSGAALPAATPAGSPSTTTTTTTERHTP